MCGIAAIFLKQERSLDNIFDMTDVQKHRGPDGHGYLFSSKSNTTYLAGESKRQCFNGHLALGHRRLSILDIDNRSSQPFQSNCGRYWISYNGEIYNYIELRTELEKYGITFRTESDTEVAIEAFAKWGTHCFSKFNGIWGIVIYDTTTQQLIVSRDRLGVKPLHYLVTAKGLFISSEIKGIIAASETPITANEKEIHEFLTNGRVNHSFDTFFSNIYAFPPGNYAIVDRHTPNLKNTQPFWSLSNIAENKSTNHLSYAESVEQTINTFENAIRYQLRSDVPVGSCLSGGLDSTAISCLANREYNGTFNTYTAGNSEDKFDETRWAKIVADSIRSNFHLVLPEEHKFTQELDKLLWHQEEPFSTASIYSQWLIMKSAKATGTIVLLDGQGADELYCGYKKYYPVYIKELIKNRKLLIASKTLLDLLIHGDRGYTRFTDARRYIKFNSTKNISTSTINNQQKKIPLVGPDVYTTQILDLSTNSLPALLRFEDRNSMAWSVESRVPFLDHNLVESALTMPTNYKLRKGRTKAALRDAMKTKIPEAIQQRKTKFNFHSPQSSWMKGRLGNLFLNEINTSNFLESTEYLAQMKSNFLSNDTPSKPDHDMCFKLAILSRWARVHRVNS